MMSLARSELKVCSTGGIEEDACFTASTRKNTPSKKPQPISSAAVAAAKKPPPIAAVTPPGLFSRKKLSKDLQKYAVLLEALKKILECFHSRAPTTWSDEEYNELFDL